MHVLNISLDHIHFMTVPIAMCVCMGGRGCECVNPSL